METTLSSTHPPPQPLFLSYLWGMETKSDALPLSYGHTVLILPMRNGNKYYRYEFVIELIVLILPMRNGNVLYVVVLAFCLFVLILPMRNGNVGISLLTYPGRFRSYPTYEEWKHVFSHSSFPLFLWFLSYLWGMETLKEGIEWEIYYRFLSYLWGMETTSPPYTSLRRMKVLILPMRNGNS